MRHEIKFRHLIRIILTLYFSILSANLFSQSDAGKKHPIDIKCEECLKADSSFTTAGMIECESVAANEWDDELNKYYKLLMAELSPDEIEQLKTAQIKWLAYRDNEILFSQTLYNNMKGTMWRVVNAARLKEIIKQRAIEIKDYYDIKTPDK